MICYSEVSKEVSKHAPVLSEGEMISTYKY